MYSIYSIILIADNLVFIPNPQGSWTGKSSPSSRPPRYRKISTRTSWRMTWGSPSSHTTGICWSVCIGGWPGVRHPRILWGYAGQSMHCYTIGRKFRPYSFIWRNFTSQTALQKRHQSHTSKNTHIFFLKMQNTVEIKLPTIRNFFKNLLAIWESLIKLNLASYRSITLPIMFKCFVSLKG